jgi:fibrillarin-like rRNA methylase
MRLSYLPYGCSVTRVRRGVTYYYCGGIWYKPVYSGTTVVYIVDTIEDGANTEVEFEEEVWDDE